MHLLFCLALAFLPAIVQAPADGDYQRGMDLARQERWPEARAAFLSGFHKAPLDKRFPIELAGVSFREGRRPESKKYILEALALDPDDVYANDFLATLYVLEGNLDAAIQRWNRIARPRIARVRAIPEPRLRPALFDRALVFAPESLLDFQEVESTRANLALLGIFPGVRFELAPGAGESFDLILRTLERNGWGGTWPERLLPMLAETPFQTVRFGLYNLRKSAEILEASFRWDPHKRRERISFSAPVNSNPRRRFRLWLDGRQEDWNTAAGGFRLESLEGGAEIQARFANTWTWKAGTALSFRKFPLHPGSEDLAGMFQDGADLRYESTTQGLMINAPAHRFQAAADARLSFGKVIASASSPYASYQGSIRWAWKPGRSILRQSISVGDFVGTPSIDRMFNLGLDRDNKMMFRGHPGVRDGLKGAGPIGCGYILWSTELERSLIRKGLWELGAGPFLDSGSVFGAPGEAQTPWMWDAGIQVRLSILRQWQFVFSVGWDLASGSRAIYLR
jgi:hypothetical protein